MPNLAQSEINFGSWQAENGFQAWLNQRRNALTQLAEKLGLPLGHPVEIWLKGDVRLNGVLQLAQTPLFVPEDRNPRLELRIDRCNFTPAEIASCVRLD
jgi:hypothetical protein